MKKKRSQLAKRHQEIATQPARIKMRDKGKKMVEYGSVPTKPSGFIGPIPF